MAAHPPWPITTTFFMLGGSLLRRAIEWQLEGFGLPATRSPSRAGLAPSRSRRRPSSTSLIPARVAICVASRTNLPWVNLPLAHKAGELPMQVPRWSPTIPTSRPFGGDVGARFANRPILCGQAGGRAEAPQLALLPRRASSWWCSPVHAVLAVPPSWPAAHR